MKKLLVILIMLTTISANAQWQPDIRLTNSNGDSFTTNNNTWCIAANGNIVHTVWMDNRDGNYEIYYKHSTNNGINWGADIRLTNNNASSRYPSVAISGLLVHVLWEDEYENNYEIHYKRSSDGGITWGADIRLTNDTSFSRYSSIAAFGSLVQIVYQDNRNNNYEIYYKKSTDGGISWSADTRLTFSTAGPWTPSIAVSDSFVHTVWYDGKDGNPEIYYKRSTNNGITWESETRLTNDASFSLNPSVAASGSNIHVVWIDYRDNNFEVYYKHSTDDGLTWGTDTRMSNATDTGFPSVVVSDSNVHIVWQEYYDGNYEIYYKCSTDGGKTWGADTRLTNNSAYSGGPCIAISSSILHVVWSDNRDGHFQIYYKRNPTGNVGIQNISTEIPSKYSLSQNYPNPFNPTTKIKFSVVSSPHVSGGDLVLLKVYDVMGREVKTLVNESQKPGTYEVSFDGSALNSGVYFYKLMTGGFTETKKMLMIK